MGGVCQVARVECSLSSHATACLPLLVGLHLNTRTCLPAALLLPQGPVWLQLKKVCCKSPACLEEFAKQWVAESESQVEVGRLQQQLADRDAQLADREAEVLRLQHALAELRGGS